MVKSVSLNPEQHGDLKHDPAAVVAFFAQQQSMELRITELVQAANVYPLFLLRDGQSRLWQPTALLGLAEGSNLFVEQGQWTGFYRPQLLDLYPFFLMVDKSTQNHRLGLDEQSPAVSNSRGKALFQDAGQPSPYLKSLERRLQSDYKDGALTYRFTARLDELKLLRPIDITVEFQDGGQQLLAGLHTINEEALNTLEAQDLVDLQQKGYLTPLYAILISLYQVNALIRQHNQRHGDRPVKRINIEAKKD